MKFKVFMALVCFCLLPSSALAEGGGSSGKFEVALSGGFLGFSSSSSQMDLAPSFYYKPLQTDLVQVGAEIGYQKTAHRGNSASNMAILAGAQMNIGPLNSAYFCAFGIALKSGSGGAAEDASQDDPNGFGYHFLCGKRIPLGGAWALKPNLGVIAGGTSGMVFRPLAVSFVF